jgi:hypothetical protein
MFHLIFSPFCHSPLSHLLSLYHSFSSNYHSLLPYFFSILAYFSFFSVFHTNFLLSSCFVSLSPLFFPRPHSFSPFLIPFFLYRYFYLPSPLRLIPFSSTFLSCFSSPSPLHLSFLICSYFLSSLNRLLVSLFRSRILLSFLSSPFTSVRRLAYSFGF